MVYTKTIFHLSVGESGAYLPPLRWIIVKYPPIFKQARVAKKIWRKINTIASIWGKNMLGYLFLDIICSSKVTHCSLLGTDNVRGQISAHIFAPNGCYCLYNTRLSLLYLLSKANGQPVLNFLVCKSSENYTNLGELDYICQRQFWRVVRGWVRGQQSTSTILVSRALLFIVPRVFGPLDQRSWKEVLIGSRKYRTSVASQQTSHWRFASVHFHCFKNQ